MGIKFLCPNGHKLNVKSFLAGKRALCPKCGARVIVPLATTGTDSDVAGGSTILTSDDMSAAGIPPAESSPGPAAPKSSGVATTTGTQPLAAVVPADPIAEAPSAVWYVRPASGGQFGPASGDIMRAWLQEGRVGASSLVWRAGWSDWRAAVATFPQLASAPAAPSASVATVPSAASANGAAPVTAVEVPIAASVPLAGRAPGAVIPESLAPILPPVRKRKNENDANLIASGVLIVIILILVIVLAVVFMRKDSSTEKETPETAPATATPEPMLN